MSKPEWRTRHFSKEADQLLELVGASDDRVDFAFTRKRGELNAIMFIDSHPSLWMIVEEA